jgi:hypothetical protein
MKYLFE